DRRGSRESVVARERKGSGVDCVAASADDGTRERHRCARVRGQVTVIDDSGADRSAGPAERECAPITRRGSGINVGAGKRESAGVDGDATRSGHGSGKCRGTAGVGGGQKLTTVDNVACKSAAGAAKSQLRS